MADTTSSPSSASTFPAASAGSADPARELKAVEARLASSPVRADAQVTLAGKGRQAQNLLYRSTAEYLPVLRHAFGKERGEPLAAVFTVSYEATQPAKSTPRPLCFVFNGGPGSSSVWLHMGAVGPWRMVVPDNGAMPTAPFAATPNPLTWLAHMDLVFIDPPETGWSLCSGDEARRQLLSTDGDVAALAEVIRAWLTRHGRWGSPVYLAGESYGTTRGAALADALASDFVGLAGLILVSCALDLQLLRFDPANDLPYAAFLPGYAAVAQFHGALKGELGESPDAARAAAEDYAQGAYLSVLHAGSRASAKERQRAARRLSELTGLSVEMVEQHGLRVPAASFFVELLRPRGLQIGRLDARVTAPLATAGAGRTVLFDPGMEAIAAPFAMASLAYFADSLGVRDERRYEFLNMATNKAWNWSRGESRGLGYCSTSTELARALRRNPRLRVLVASGYYDLGTPYSATDWSLAQLDLPAEAQARITHHRYEAGHMMYTRDADCRSLAGDVAKWLGAAA